MLIKHPITHKVMVFLLETNERNDLRRRYRECRERDMTPNIARAVVWSGAHFVESGSERELHASRER